MIKAIMKIHTTSSTLHLYVAMLPLLETVSFGLHQEKWMALSCMPTLYSMKTGRSSHGMNRKI